MHIRTYMLGGNFYTVHTYMYVGRCIYGEPAKKYVTGLYFGPL